MASVHTTPLVSLDALRSAARVLQGVAVRTPLLPADTLTAELGVPVWVKPEMLQRGGAFKFRGAYTFLSALSEQARGRGVIAPSSGNHAQAVALAAQLYGVPATVVMPTTVTAAKRGGAERLGARVVLAGQGTIGLEIVEDLPSVHTVLVPVGGGGLSAGVATAVKLLAPETRVVGVEPEGAAKLTHARAAGKPARLERSESIADGLLALQIGDINFAHHQAYLDDVVTVSDAAIVRAMRFLLDRLKLVVEPSGAATIAALLSGALVPTGSTVCVLSGGNIEWPGLLELLGRA